MGGTATRNEVKTLYRNKEKGVGGEIRQIYLNSGRITQYVSSVTWSGSARQAARTLEFSLAYSPQDSNIGSPKIVLGDKVTLYNDNKTRVFTGFITSREKKSEAGTLTYTAQDNMMHLLRSKATYKFTNTTPEKIAKKVANDVGVKIESLVKTKHKISKAFFKERPIYEIIMAGYTDAHKKNGKVYIAQMKDRKLSVIVKGKMIQKFQLKQGERIITSTLTETNENMVNRVAIYNSSNKKIGTISNSNWVSKYGVFQEALTVDSGNGKTEAKTMLNGIEKTANVSCLGDTRCVSGRGVAITDTKTGLNGAFWIESDTHTWEDNAYTMELELAFKNFMDEQEFDEEETQVTANGGVLTVSTGCSTAAETATAQMETWANDQSHGYSQSNRWGPDYDCSSAVITAYEIAGVPVKSRGATYTGNMYSVFIACGFRDVTGSCNLGSGAGMQRGDVLLNVVHHTAMCCGNGSMVHARGQSYGSSATGDQGQEFAITGYSNYPWNYVLRYGTAETTTVTNGTTSATAYALSQAQLVGLARLCQQEQGSKIGAMAEASLMANLFEKRGRSYGSGASGLYNYVRNGGWFANAGHFMDSGALSSDVLEGVRSVLIGGKRTLPTYIDEHDCFSDISSCTNNGVGFSPSNRSGYQSGVTKIRNRYGSSYTFYCFPTSTSDPFGYTSR